MASQQFTLTLKSWTFKFFSSYPDHDGNGGIRGILQDGDTLVATGYTDGFEGGCLFINEEGSAMVWTFDLEGNLKASQTIDIEGLGQGARVKTFFHSQLMNNSL